MRFVAPASFWSVSDAPRVTVDRISSASAVYQAGRVRYAPGGGLWFLARWSDGWQTRGELALRALGDAGLGGERAVGHGQYTLRGPWQVKPFTDPAPSERMALLAPGYPRAEDLPPVIGADAASAVGVNYGLIARRGWMSSPDEGMTVDRAGQPQGVSGGAMRRKTVLMFAEGSLLRSTGRPYMGQLADVTPKILSSHPVYRYGLGIAVACAEPWLASEEEEHA